MEYALLIYDSPSDFAARDGAESEQFWAAWRNYMNALNEAGLRRGGTGLQPPETAALVRAANGHRTVHDGPYADTKEQLGGVVIVDVPTLDVALDWAARCPIAATGSVEVRPVLPRGAGI